MNKHLSYKFAVLACAVGTILTPVAAKAANFNYHVDLNVASLVGNPSGPFSLDFFLNKGNSVANNTITISNFVLTGGTATGTATNDFGLASGNLSSTITLNENSSNQLNDIYQAFSSSTTDIQFDVSMTQFFAGTQPDGFSVSILDSSLNNIVTTDFNGNSMLSAPITTANTLGDVSTFSSTSPSGATATVTSAVPEPSAIAALLGGGGCLLGFRRRRMQMV